VFGSWQGLMAHGRRLPPQGGRVPITSTTSRLPSSGATLSGALR
jgi:hypothetical protein